MHQDSSLPCVLCPHFGVCGGCQWQQIAYSEQLQKKEEKIALLFQEFGVFPRSIIPSESPWHYRNKLELSFSSDLSGKRYLGLMMRGARRRVLDLQTCLLGEPWMVQATERVRQWWGETDLLAYKPHKDSGSLRTLTLRSGYASGDRLVMLTVSGRVEAALTKLQLQDFVQALSPLEKEGELSVILRIQQAVKGRPTQFYEMVLYGRDHVREEIRLSACETIHCRVSPSAFFQPNRFLFSRLYQTALELADLHPDMHVLDLYCGTGTLTACAAKRAKEVIGIELSREAVVDAQENQKQNSLSNMQVMAGDVGKTLEELYGHSSKKRPDCIFIDPPRSGLDAKAIQCLLSLQAPKIVYISCCPETQCINVQTLVGAGYRVAIIQPIDQFPQTTHVENIVLLQKDEEPV